MAGNAEQTIGQFSPFTYGKALPERDRNPTGRVPVFGSNGIVGYHDTPLTDGPTVVIGRKGTVGEVHYSAVPCWPIDTTFFVTGHDPSLVRYKYFVLKSVGLEHMNADSAVPGLNRDAAHARMLHVPEEGEQRAIAHILGTLDDKIELNRRTNETLEEMARALFHSWFVRFDPVRAKAAGRDPGLPREIADLFPDAFEESELGEVPMGWKVGPVSGLATLSHQTINPGDFPEEMFDHFSIPAFDEGRRPKAELGRAIKSSKLLVPRDSILLSKLNPRIRRIWLPAVRSDHRPICSTEFLVTLPRAGISREFLYGFLSNDAFASVFETLVTGTSGSHQRVKPESLLNIDTVLPDGQVIEQFTHTVRPMLMRVDQGRQESEALAALRDTLLPRLVSGELRVGSKGGYHGG